jgi:hypothetical protein
MRRHNAPLGASGVAFVACELLFWLRDSVVLRFRKSSVADFVAKLRISATFNRATVEGAS